MATTEQGIKRTLLRQTLKSVVRRFASLSPKEGEKQMAEMPLSELIDSVGSIRENLKDPKKVEEAGTKALRNILPVGSTMKGEFYTVTSVECSRTYYDIPPEIQAQYRRESTYVKLEFTKNV